MFHNFHNSIRRPVVCCLTAFMLSAGAAMADQTLTETFFIAGNVQDATSTGAFTLPAFDPTLGTLESIQLTLSITNKSKIQVFNSSTSPENFTNASLNLTGDVQGPSNLDMMTTLTSSLASGTAQPGINTYATTATTKTATQSVDLSLLSLWEGQPDSVIDFTYTKGNPTFQGTDTGHSLFFGGSAEGTGQFTVAYTYISAALATPEPSGRYLSVLVACAITLMLLGRRKLLGA